MAATLQKIVEQVNGLSEEDRDELTRLLSEGVEYTPTIQAEQARLLGGCCSISSRATR